MTDITTIWQFDLRRGNSPDPREGACLLDAVSWFQYGMLGDHPPCTCPVQAAFGRPINDFLSDAGRQRLKIFIPRLVGTVDPASEPARAEYLAWRAIRVFAPLALDAAGLPREAARLRKSKTLKAAARTARAAASAADSAADSAAASASAYAYAAAAFAADSAAAASVAASAAASVAAGYAADSAGAAGATFAADSVAAGYAAFAADSAAAASVAAGYAADSAGAAGATVEDAIIETMDGVLRIGRQAEPISPERVAEAVRAFALARGEVAQ